MCAVSVPPDLLHELKLEAQQTTILEEAPDMDGMELDNDLVSSSFEAYHSLTGRTTLPQLPALNRVFTILCTSHSLPLLVTAYPSSHRNTIIPLGFLNRH